MANVVPIPKVPPTPVAAEWRHISLTAILSKVFERLVVVRLSLHLEVGKHFPATQFAYRSGLGTCDALLTMTD